MAGMDNATGGRLAQGSPWRTDIPGRSEAISYNKPNGYTIGGNGPYESPAAQADAISRQDSAICGKASLENKAVPSAPGY